jgi:membrane protein
MAGAPERLLVRARTFFAVQVWEMPPAGASRLRALLYRSSRIAYATVRGFFDHRLTVRAAALTYYSVLSVVPFLAFAFSVLKGFGAYRVFVQDTVRPYLDETFAPSPALRQAIDRILAFVDTTDFSRVGAIGLVALVYTSISLVSSVEAALNEVFGVRTTRPFLRQVTDYVTLLVTAPLLVFAATATSAAAQSSRLVAFLRGRLALGQVIDVALGITPIAVVALALFAMYVILPNVRMRPGSALAGAVLAALAWEGALVVQVQLQMGVAGYNAIYSVLGAIPIFLVWTYASWLIVLLGAEVAASHQNDAAARVRLAASHADAALREALALAATARIARDFLDGGPRRGSSELAALLDVPQPIADEVLDALVRAGVLARTLSERGIAFVPGRDLDDLRASDVREAVRRDPRADEVRRGLERGMGPDLQRLLRAEEEERRSSPHDLTLRELAALSRDERAAPGPRAPAPPRPAGVHREPVVDGKQPDLH